MNLLPMQMRVEYVFPHKEKLEEAERRHDMLSKKISATIGGQQDNIIEMSFEKSAKRGISI